MFIHVNKSGYRWRARVVDAYLSSSFSHNLHHNVRYRLFAYVKNGISRKLFLRARQV